MTGRRKGTPCACETDPCNCGSSKGKCIRTINNISPDANGDIFIDAGTGVTITQTGDNTFEISFDGTPSQPMVFKGTVGSGGTVSVLPAADPDNIGWTYIAIEDGTVPVTYASGDTLVSNGYTWVVIPSGDDPVDWSQILNKPDTIAGYGITDAYTKAEVDAVDDTKLDKLTGSSGFRRAYTHLGATQGDVDIVSSPFPDTILIRDQYGHGEVADAPSGATDDTAVNANWVSQTGNSSPNNLVHRIGDESLAGTKTFTGTAYVNGAFGYKTKVYGNAVQSGKYNRIARITPGAIGGCFTAMIWSTKGHSDIFRNRNGIIYIQARSTGTLGLNFVWMTKGSQIQNEQLALTYDGTNIELWGLMTNSDVNNELMAFQVLTESNSGSAPYDLVKIETDSIKTRAELAAYQNYSFSA